MILKKSGQKKTSPKRGKNREGFYLSCLLQLLAALATRIRSRTSTASGALVLLVPLVQVVVVFAFALSH